MRQAEDEYGVIPAHARAVRSMRARHAATKNGYWRNVPTKFAAVCACGVFGSTGTAPDGADWPGAGTATRAAGSCCAGVD
jgi:hypothetical protein